MRAPRATAPEALPTAAIVAAGVLILLTMGLLTLVWATASPVLGRLYAGIRIAESAGLWLFTGWGRYFTHVPAGEPFAFWSIFKSSVPFGLGAGLATAMIGWLAYRKVAIRHLDAVLAAPPDGFTAGAILRDLKDVLPHVPAVTARVEPVTVAPRPTRPSTNPFADLRDLRDAAAVADAATSLSWTEAATFALVIDALAPIGDRKPVDSLIGATWRAARAAASGIATEPSPADRDLAQAVLTRVATDLAGRDMVTLDHAHVALATEGTAHDALVALTGLARVRKTFPVKEVAWARLVDPHLHERIIAAH